MTEKVKRLHIKEYEDSWGDYIESQTVTDDDGKRLFRVCDLSECPEDAIIGRDLFDAYDYISAIEYGMEIARQGYTSIEVETVTVSDE